MCCCGSIHVARTKMKLNRRNQDEISVSFVIVIVIACVELPSHIASRSQEQIENCDTRTDDTVGHKSNQYNTK
jgi:hypothetical protein